MDNTDSNKAEQPAFTVEHPCHPESICSVVYRHPIANEEGRVYAVLERVAFNSRCPGKFMRATLMLLPVWIEVNPLETLPAQFAALRGKGCTVRDITLHKASFDTFWNAYAYKVGNKTRCRSLWSKLDDTDRQLAFGGIERQRRHSQKHNIDMPYPETYLRQRRWENIFND